MMPCFQMTTKSNDLTIEEWSKMAKFVRILLVDHEKKLIAIEGQVEEGEGDDKTIKSGVLVLEKTPFEFDEVVTMIKGDEHQFKIDLINDIYRYYTIATQSICNGMFSMTVLSTN